MSAKIVIVFYSMYGHTFHLGQAIKEGAETAGAEVKMVQIKETLPPEVLEKMHASGAKKEWADLPVATPDDLKEADAIFIGSPTRYGSVCAQVQTFFDSTGGLWQSGALVGKIGSGFVSTATQHGGQETTFDSLHKFFLHHGMLVSGCPYAAPGLMNLDEITGGTPYGASTVAGTKGERSVTDNEKQIARFQGKTVAELAAKLAG